jgi:flagellar basal body rod protein FlgG
MALDKIGVNSLVAVNSWIGIINGNMQGTSRTAYKPTRLSITDGLGQLYTTTDAYVPASTMSVQATTMEWGQGSIVNSESSAHFAIQGEGFFVLADDAGRYFLTRDGEFHWTSEGYLANSAGLKVVSSGQGFIRKDPTDRSDIFSIDGYSKELTKYGDKAFLLVSAANRDGLLMSQYGSTVFQLDGDLPLRIKNDFSTTTDGLTYIYDDPYVLPAVNDPGWVPFVAVPPPNYSSDFSINFGVNGTFNFNAFNPLGVGVDFNPNPVAAGNTISHIVAAINAYGATVGGRVSAVYEPVQDRLIIRNEQTAPGANTQIVFGGANGQAMRNFFKFGFNQASSNDQDLNANGVLETVLRSYEDIDNSTNAQFDSLDVGNAPGPGVFYPISGPETSIGLYSEPAVRYDHDKVNGFVRARNTSGSAGMVVGESRATSEFELELDVKVSNNGGSTILIGLGQDDPHNLNSGGFGIVYDPVAGTVRLLQYPRGYTFNGQAKTPFQIAPPAGTLPMAAIAVADGGAGVPLAGNTARLVVTLNADKVLTFSVNGTLQTFDLGGAGTDISGYVSVRNDFNNLEIHGMVADLKGKYNHLRAGDIFSVNQTNFAAVEVKNAWQERQRSRIAQASLETSTASLTEYVPMLGLAQKVFAAISKIISTHNAVVDDINSLFR